jgi:hypothetical protein
MTESERRFPPPWTIEELRESFIIHDASGQPLAYIYFDDEPRRQMSPGTVIFPEPRYNHHPRPMWWHTYGPMTSSR